MAGIFAPENAFLIALAALAAGGLALDLARFGIGPLNRIYLRWMAPLLKSDEEFHITGANIHADSRFDGFWALR